MRNERQGRRREEEAGRVRGSVSRFDFISKWLKQLVLGQMEGGRKAVHPGLSHMGCEAPSAWDIICHFPMSLNMKPDWTQSGQESNCHLIQDASNVMGS